MPPDTADTPDPATLKSADMEWILHWTCPDCEVDNRTKPVQDNRGFVRSPKVVCCGRCGHPFAGEGWSK